MKKAECKEAERTFVVVGGLESETPDSNLCTKNKLVLFSKYKLLSLIDGYMVELKHRNTADISVSSKLPAALQQKLYLSHFLRHYFPVSLIHIYSLVLLMVKINSCCM
jgi:hypothetical protein